MQDQTKSVIFVCTSNTCRSPMAAALGNHIMTRFSCSSRVLTDAYEPPGSAPAVNAVAVLKEDFGLDHSAHRSSLLTEEDLLQANFIVGLTKNHLRHILNAFPVAKNPEIASKMLTIGCDIEDPWHQEQAVYRACAHQIHEQIPKLARRLNEATSSS